MKLWRLTTPLCAVGLMTLGTLPIAHATMITPISVTASSTFSAYSVDNLINDSGLSGLVHDTNFNNMWLSDHSVTAVLTFELDSVFDLEGAYIWQYNADCCTTSRGVKNFNLATSTDGVVFKPKLAAATLAQASGSTDIAPQFFSFAEPEKAQFVRVSVTSNYGDPYTGLSEFKLAKAMSAPSPSVPEPSGFYLMLLSILGFSAVEMKKRMLQNKRNLLNY